ncbi:hypothetical protein YC2023_030773 [Brassica napus]
MFLSQHHDISFPSLQVRLEKLHCCFFHRQLSLVALSLIDSSQAASLLTRCGESHIACEYQCIKPERHTNSHSSSIASQTKHRNHSPANWDMEQKCGYGSVEQRQNQRLCLKIPSEWYDNSLSEQTRYEPKGVGASDSGDVRVLSEGDQKLLDVNPKN